MSGVVGAAHVCTFARDGRRCGVLVGWQVLIIVALSAAAISTLLIL